MKSELEKYRPKERLVITNDDLDHAWYPSQIEHAVRMINCGNTDRAIARWFGRDLDEVRILKIHLRRKGLISDEYSKSA